MSRDLSELQILDAARRTKTVFDAMWGMLDALENKNEIEQQANTAKGRLEQVQLDEQLARNKLAAVNKDITDAEKEAKEAKDRAAKIISDAKAQAEVTRIAAANEASQIIKSAEEESKSAMAEISRKQADADAEITKRQGDLEKLLAAIEAADAKLSGIQGKLDAAKDEIRKKFLN